MSQQARIEDAAVRAAPSAAPPARAERIRRTLLLLVAAVVVLALLAGAMAPSRAAASPGDPLPGSTETFYAFDWGHEVVIQVKGVLRLAGERCLVYVQEGRQLPEVIAQDLVAEFDGNVYPKVTEALGSEPNPGIDGDPRVVILLYGFNDAALMGSFYPYDLIPHGSLILPESEIASSNHREMFYLNLDAVLIQPDRAAATAAHELAHLIIYYRDFLLDGLPQRKYEGSVAQWVEEGLAMYAELAAGYRDRAQVQLLSFQMSPNKNLTRWLGGYFSDYGASYAFVTYLVDRLGLDLAAQLVNQPADGIAGINAVLRSRGAFETFASLFDDWVITNYMDSRPPANSPYAYAQIHLAAEPLPLSGPLPAVGTGRVENFGAVYLDLPEMEVDSTATVHAVLDGDDGAPLHAALLSWDSSGLLQPSITLLTLSPVVAGGTAVSPPGYDRHTLAVWSRGSEGAAASYGFRYSLAVDPPGGMQFLDVGGDHRFFGFIEELQARGVVNGKESPPGSGLWYFGPDEPVLRAQFAKMIVEATGLHTPEVDGTTAPTFKDVIPTFGGQGDPLPYPFDYVEEAGKAGIVGGYSDGRFGPWDPIKRIQLVRMILRGAAAAGHPFPAYTGSEPVFADVPPGSSLYPDTMTAYENGIMSGAVGKDGKRYFDPWTSATRGQVAKMTFNLLQFLGL